MPDFSRAMCKRCEKHRDEVGAISWSGLCLQCGLARCAENIVGLATMTDPPVVNRWRKGHVEAVGGVLLDDLADEG